MSKFPFLFAFLIILAFTGPARAEKTRILYLGDSLSMGAFGRTLDSGLRSQGAEVYTAVAGGASPYYWLKAYQSLPSSIGFWEKTPINERRIGYVRAVPKLEDMLEDYNPHFVVVQTGINLYATLRSRRRPKDENVLEIRSLIEQMSHSIAKSGATPYWILPPHSHERRYSIELQNELRSIMRNVINDYGGAVFESAEVTRFTDPYPATDGIHYGPAEAAAWAQKVRADLAVFIHENKTAKPETIRMTEVIPLKPVQKEQDPPAMNPTAEIASAKAPETPSPVFSKPVIKASAASATAPGAIKVPEKPLPKLPGAGSNIKVFNRLDLDLCLIAKSEITNIAEIDYANALGVFEYEVVKDRLGNYPYEKIRIAHGIVFRRKFTSAAMRQIGSQISLRLVPLASYKNLQTWQTDDDLPPNYEMPLYTPKLD
ncbi:MAG: hypothetical protein P1V20_11255 [Verrucomicrobiales bacterium]|nr:hypothetical protein [Verrucomicrobiales bacterium]